MKLLITLKLLDINLGNHIIPITQLDMVERIFIVRDTEGPVIDKVSYHTPPPWSLRYPPMNFFFKFFTLIKIALKERTDLIIGYLFFPHGLLAYFAGIVTKTKVAVNFIAGIREVYGYSGQGSAVKEMVYTRPLPPLTILNRINLMIIKNLSVLLVGGAYSRNQLIRMGVDGRKIYILYKPQIGFFPQTEQEKEFDIVYVGRLGVIKRVDSIIKITDTIRKVMPDVSVGIIGDGPERSALELMTDNLGLRQNVSFLGWQENPSDWLNKGKLSILTSGREGFPQSIVQSLSCGVPVVVSACGDITDLVKDNYNGFVIQDHEDIEGFSKAIIYLLRNPDKLLEFSLNSIQTVNSYLDVNEVKKTWESVLGSISSE